MVLRRVSPREAWEGCGKPKGEAGIQNIRKRAREERARPQAAPPPEPRRAASGPGRGVPKAGFRLRKEQRTVIVQQQKDLKQQYAQAYADATADWQRRVSAGKMGKGFDSADVVAAKYEVPEGKKLTGEMLKQAVRDGRAGQPPPMRGSYPNALPSLCVSSFRRSHSASPCRNLPA